MSLDEFIKREHAILWDLISLYNKIPNPFTYYQIDFFAHHWCDYYGEKTFRNKGFDGISKNALKKAKKYKLNCKDWKFFAYWKKNNDIVEGIKLFTAGNKYSPKDKLFHGEHHLPRSQIVGLLIKATSIKNMTEILSKSKFYIITSEENALLTEKHWSRNRPEDAYDQLGIDIIEDYWD